MKCSAPLARGVTALVISAGVGLAPAQTPPATGQSTADPAALMRECIAKERARHNNVSMTEARKTCRGDMQSRATPTALKSAAGTAPESARTPEYTIPSRSSPAQVPKSPTSD